MTPKEPTVVFGVVADVQYSDKDILPTHPHKNYRGALRHLETAVNDFLAQPNIDFTIQLGDIIEGTEGKNQTQDKLDLDETTAQLRRLNKKPHYNVLGNHCLSLPREVLYRELDLKTPYYSFVLKDWRFIVLDTQDMSLNWPATSSNHIMAKGWVEKGSLPWNGGLMKDQMEWMLREFDDAQKANQKVIVFGHIPI
eukprot:Ihof_evm1s634 gene=Ihof_evmTU1s634